MSRIILSKLYSLKSEKIVNSFQNDKSRFSFRTNQILHYYFIATLFVAPLYFGGDRLFAWGGIGAAQSALYCALSFYHRSPPQELQLVNRIELFGAAGLSCVLIWAALQLVSFHQNPFAQDIWAFAQPYIEMPEQYPLSVTPDEGYLTLLKIIAAIITMLNARALYGSFVRANRLIGAIATIGTFYAILGLYWIKASPSGHFWLAQSPYQNSVVSTFVNRNSFAQYIGMCSICAFMLTIRSWRAMPRTRFSWPSLQTALPITFRKFLYSASIFFVLLVALFMSGSRGGFAFALVSYAVLIILQFFNRENEKKWTAFSIILLGFGGYMFFHIYGVMIDERSASLLTDFYSRINLYREIWSAISDRPILGYGLGSFENVFRYHRSVNFDPAGLWMRAHNVYLEATLALGIPASILTTLVAIVPLVLSFLKILDRKQNTISSIMISIWFLVMLSSLFDFGIQTGANAITFAAIVGASLSPRSGRIHSIQRF